MNNPPQSTTRVRINITLPGETLKLLDRLSKKGDRSKFLDRAVKFYIKTNGQANLREKLKQEAIEDAARDLAITNEWLHLDEEVWNK